MLSDHPYRFNNALKDSASKSKVSRLHLHSYHYKELKAKGSRTLTNLRTCAEKQVGTMKDYDESLTALSVLNLASAENRHAPVESKHQHRSVHSSLSYVIVGKSNSNIT